MQDYFSLIFESINRLLDQQAGMFEAMGMSLFRSIAVILISWFGVQSALSSASGGGGFNWPRFVALIQVLLIDGAAAGGAAGAAGTGRAKDVLACPASGICRGSIDRRKQAAALEFIGRPRLAHARL